ncbi:MAG: SIR2 family protein [Flavobacteriales bacterium]
MNAKERRKLFQDYIHDSKVNTAHIYLAQLVDLGYIDYVLTVNFDDLLLRACGLFNYTMPTYDISNISEFTTTTFQKHSITYLHGQHYGEWLLNAKGELNKVKDRIPELLNKICHDRTFIIVGYSGEDEVFDCIKTFASFDNELFWVNYLDHKPSESVSENLLDISTKNAHSISGYDADTFFLDLHSKLEVETPKIIDKPFSFLKSMMDEVKIPEEDDVKENHKELYKSLSERLEISNRWIERAINEIEEDDSVEKFKQEIIEAYVKEKFEENEQNFLNKINEDKFRNAKPELSDFYLAWGNKIKDENSTNNDENYFNEISAKYKKAIELNAKNDIIYNNYGNLIGDRAQLLSDTNLFNESFVLHKKAINVNPKIAINYANYGISLSDLAELTKDENTYQKSFAQYKKAIELNPKNENFHYNYGTTLSKFAILKSDVNLFKEGFTKFEMAIKLNPKNFKSYDNYGNSLSDFAKFSSDETFLKESLNQLKKGHELGGDCYNLSCCYALLNDKPNFLKYLKETLEKDKTTINQINNDEDFKKFREDEDFKKLLSQYKNN